ncbi:protein broad-minded-like [Centruroides vittatus]|uniref:protein broad-minded-like n=1 Tax=Centruroides vittatus TaxID=120091 RepID=UPI00350F7AE9
MNFKSDEEKELYQSVRSKLNQNLKDYITTLIRKFKFDVEGETVPTDKIVDEVSKSTCESDVFKKLRRSFLMDIVQQNKITFDQNVKESHCEWETNPNHSSVSINSSLSSTLNQCGYLIVDVKDLQNAEKLLQSSLVRSKLQALNILNRISSMDQLILPSIWTPLEISLQNTLLHPVSIVSELCLNVYIKMLSCSSPQVVKESYDSLLKFLSLHSIEESQEMQSVYFLSKKEIFLQVFIMVNKFQRYIVKSWLRYPQHIIKEMIQNTFRQILESLMEEERNYNFLKIFIIVDPRANWLKNWMHSNLSRQYVIDKLKEYSKIIEWALSVFETSNEKRLNNNFETFFSIYFVGRLLQYSEGCKLILSVYYDMSFVSGITKICNSLINYMWKFYKMNNDVLKSGMNFLCKTIYCLWENEIYKWNIEDKIEILQHLLLSVDKLRSVEHSEVIYFLNHIVKLINSISAINSVKKDLMNECLKIHKQFIYVFDYLKQFSESEERNLQILHDEILIHLLKTCRNILILPQGMLWANASTIIPVLIQSVRNLQLRKYESHTPTPCCTSTFEIFDKDKTELEIFRIVYIFLSFPLGVYLLTEADFLIETIDILIENYLEIYNSQCSESCNCYKACLFLFAYYPLSKQILHKENLLLSFPNKMWQISKDVNQENYVDDQQSLLGYPTVNHLKCLIFTHSTFKIIFSDIFSKVDVLNADNIWKSICFYSHDTLYENVDINIISLHLLSFLICNIKTSLFLQKKFDIANFLMELLNNHISSDCNIIIDENSLIWNHILIRLHLIGGPNERKLPSISSINNVWPFFNACSVDKEYWIASSENCIDNQLSLSVTQIDDKWNFYRNVFLDHLKTNRNMSCQQISLLLEEIIKYIPVVNANVNFDCHSSLSDLTEDEKFGVELTVHYGNNLNLFTSENNGENLEYILKSCRLLINNKKCEEFDIFLATLFLALKGNRDVCYQFCKSYIQSESCIYNWILASDQALEQDTKLQLIHAFLSQYFEVILEETVPFIYSAFQSAGIPPSIILWNWTSQCFWNYLDWNEICHWLIFTICNGDCILYFSVAILRHLKQDILKHAQENSLLDYLRESAIHNFKLCNHIMFILELFEKYHHCIKENIHKILLIN